jgi:N-acetylglucosaminyldiphosphoundecaprenol N-acetyl-beta-D-mannosaminyltransferase
MIDTLDMFGVRIAATNLAAACQRIDGWIQNKSKVYVCIAPVSTIVDCQSDSEYREVINRSGMTTPDGMPLVWIGRSRGKKDMSRTYGPDLMLSLAEYGLDKGFRHFFYGGTSATNELLISRVKAKFPRINIVGSYAPGMLKLKEKEQRGVIETINSAKPDVLWVGLGSPKQDYWMSLHRLDLSAPVLIGVGAAFDFLAGVKKQAPKWMQKFGLEWLFRLMCEPKRLWRRYLIGNSKFIWLVIKSWFHPQTTNIS